MAVLIVEDDGLVARTIGRILKSRAELAFASTTSAAMKWLDANEPIALIVDVMANGVGFAVVEHERRLRHRPPPS